MKPALIHLISVMKKSLKQHKDFKKCSTIEEHLVEITGELQYRFEIHVQEFPAGSGYVRNPNLISNHLYILDKKDLEYFIERFDKDVEKEKAIRKKVKDYELKLRLEIVNETECIECGAVINSRIKKARCKNCV